MLRRRQQVTPDHKTLNNNIQQGPSAHGNAQQGPSAHDVAANVLRRQVNQSREFRLTDTPVPPLSPITGRRRQAPNNLFGHKNSTLSRGLPETMEFLDESREDSVYMNITVTDNTVVRTEAISPEGEKL